MNLLERLKALRDYYKSATHAEHNNLLLEGTEYYDNEINILTSGSNEPAMLGLSSDMCIDVADINERTLKDIDGALGITSSAMEALLHEIIPRLEKLQRWEDSLDALTNKRVSENSKLIPYTSIPFLSKEKRE